MKLHTEKLTGKFKHVTSYAEVWIEITVCPATGEPETSPPTRRCGLKLDFGTPAASASSVTSYAEVWIEIGGVLIEYPEKEVTSYAEVWIEIYADEQYEWQRGHLLRGGVD